MKDIIAICSIVSGVIAVVFFCIWLGASGPEYIDIFQQTWIVAGIFFLLIAGAGIFFEAGAKSKSKGD